MLAVESDESVLEAEKLRLLKYLWKTKAPSKALIFGWQMILSRLLLRVELSKCLIIVGTHNTICSLCFLDDESLDHIFLLCHVLNRIWVEACGWFGAVVSSWFGSLADCILVFIEVVESAVKRSMFWFLGLVICWVIWSCRIVIIFKGGLLIKIDVLGMTNFIS